MFTDPDVECRCAPGKGGFEINKNFNLLSNPDDYRDRRFCKLFLKIPKGPLPLSNCESKWKLIHVTFGIIIVIAECECALSQQQVLKQQYNDCVSDVITVNLSGYFGQYCESFEPCGTIFCQ